MHIIKVNLLQINLNTRKKVKSVQKNIWTQNPIINSSQIIKQHVECCAFNCLDKHRQILFLVCIKWYFSDQWIQNATTRSVYYSWWSVMSSCWEIWAICNVGRKKTEKICNQQQYIQFTLTHHQQHINK